MSLQFLLLLLLLAVPASAQFKIDGAVELHIWLTAKPGQEAALEKTFTEVFYPALSKREGFRGALLMRKPNTREYTVRLSFESEDLRLQWVASDEHQLAWPALKGHSEEPKYDGFAVIHPK